MKPALDKYQRRWVDWRTELAAGSLHYAPDSPLQFLMCFLKYVLSIVVLQYILARVAGDRAEKKTDAKGRRLVDRGSVYSIGFASSHRPTTTAGSTTCISCKYGHLQ